MIRLLVIKFFELIVVLIVVTFACVALLQLVPPAGHIERVLISGDPTNPVVHAQQMALRHDLGLDKSLIAQYWQWLTNALHGDFGKYYGVSGGQEVSTRIAQALPVSLTLLVASQVLTLLIAIPLGIWSAYRSGTKTDRGINAVAFAALAIPNYALGILLSYYIGAKLHWLPANGANWQAGSLVDHVRVFILPTIALSLGQIPVYQRLLRSDMIQTLQEDFILVAKAKGLSNKRVLWRHALRPSSLTTVTVAGLNIGTLIGGAIAIEVVFQLPGMGFMIFDAISRRQFVALQGAVAVVVVGFVLINFIVDLLYRYLDPRVRDARSTS